MIEPVIILSVDDFNALKKRIVKANNFSIFAYILIGLIITVCFINPLVFEFIKSAALIVWLLVYVFVIYKFIVKKLLDELWIHNIAFENMHEKILLYKTKCIERTKLTYSMPIESGGHKHKSTYTDTYYTVADSHDIVISIDEKIGYRSQSLSKFRLLWNDDADSVKRIQGNGEDVYVIVFFKDKRLLNVGLIPYEL